MKINRNFSIWYITPRSLKLFGFEEYKNVFKRDGVIIIKHPLNDKRHTISFIESDDRESFAFSITTNFELVMLTLLLKNSIYSKI